MSRTSPNATSRLQQVSNYFSTSSGPAQKFRVAVIGSGNWGTTVAKVIAENTALRSDEFHKDVKMWVYQEQINGRNITDIINEEHENVKYLNGIKLPHNLIAEPSIVETANDADLLIFNIPHQFLPRVCEQLKGHVKSGARAVSCLKGLDVTPHGCKLLSTYITENLGVYCGSLSGANLAPEVAKEKWSETTVGYLLPKDFRGSGKDIDQKTLKHLFHRPYFHVRVIEDIAGVSLAGALKNIVAVAAGFVEGLGWGDNAKSAVMRVGLSETVKFAEKFFPESNPSTFYAESAGVADLITTCSGGRNVRVAAHMAKTGKSAQESELELLNGQSAQGIITAKEVHELLVNQNCVEEFPLFEATYQIIYNNQDMTKLPELIEDDDD